MPAYYRPAILLLFCIILLYSCDRSSGSHTSSPKTSDVDSSLINKLLQRIDSVDHWSWYAAQKELPALKASALHAGSKARGLYYYLEGSLLADADSTAAADSSFRQMLPPGHLDTAANLSLVVLQQLGLQHLAVTKKVDDSSFAQLYSLIDFTQRFQYPDMWKVYQLAAEEHFRYGMLDKAEIFTRKAIASYSDRKDYFRYSIFMEELSRIAEHQENLRKALQYEDSALHYALRQPDSIRIATVYSALGVLYEKNKDQKTGHELMIRALRIKEPRNKVTFREYLNYGQALMEEKNYPAAIEYVEKALAKARVTPSTNHLNAAYGTLYELYYNMGDYKQAILYLDSTSSTALKELQEEQLKKVTELQAVNDLKEQQHKTFDLSRQYNNQATILRQQQFILVILAVLLAVGVMLTYVLIRQRKLRSQKQEIELEQRLLRSQMEPHFIFNTLAVLQSFVRQGEKENAVKYLNKFARLLRLNLENSRQNLVQLYQEVEALENYLSLQALRFGNTFNYTIHNIDDCAQQDILVPPMLLQPFVENAIQHGMRNLPYKGEITVTLQLSNDLLHCVIEDNGLGLQQPQEQEKASLSGTITQERLKLLSQQTGNLASLTITDKKESGSSGVKVTLIIPVQHQR